MKTRNRVETDPLPSRSTWFDGVTNWDTAYELQQLSFFIALLGPRWHTDIMKSLPVTTLPLGILSYLPLCLRRLIGGTSHLSMCSYSLIHWFIQASLMSKYGKSKWKSRKTLDLLGLTGGKLYFILEAVNDEVPFGELMKSFKYGWRHTNSKKYIEHVYKLT